MVIFTTGAIAVIGIAIPYTPLGTALSMEHPNASFLGFLPVILICYCLLVQIVKTTYIRVFKEWL